MVFETLAAAVGWTAAVQCSLIRQPWPQEIVNSDLCRAVVRKEEASTDGVESEKTPAALREENIRSPVRRNVSRRKISGGRPPRVPVRQAAVATEEEQEEELESSDASSCLMESMRSRSSASSGAFSSASARYACCLLAALTTTTSHHVCVCVCVCVNVCFVCSVCVLVCVVDLVVLVAVSLTTCCGAGCVCGWEFTQALR